MKPRKEARRRRVLDPRPPLRGSPKNLAKAKPSLCQESFQRPRALLEPITSEPVRRLGLGSSSRQNPDRPSPYHKQFGRVLENQSRTGRKITEQPISQGSSWSEFAKTNDRRKETSYSTPAIQ